MKRQKTQPFNEIALELARIAVRGLETLETRNSDRLDFHEVSVWGLRRALLEAYTAGVATGAKAKAKGE